jgi:hypothetical protein
MCPTDAIQHVHELRIMNIKNVPRLSVHGSYT